MWIRQDRAWYRFITPFFINHDYPCHTTPRQNVNETMTRQRGDTTTRRHDDTTTHADTLQTLCSGGDEARVDQYLLVFLKFIQSVVPTINYDFTMEIKAKN